MSEKYTKEELLKIDVLVYNWVVNAAHEQMCSKLANNKSINIVAKPNNMYDLYVDKWGEATWEEALNATKSSG